jgi:hypothetical protein
MQLLRLQLRRRRRRRRRRRPAEALHVLTRTASMLHLYCPYRLQLMEASQYRMLGKAEWDAAMAEDFLVGAAEVLLR